MSVRIGNGFDVHALVPGRKLILGGVEIPFERGLDGHSDADVLLHAITDAILGALAWATSAAIFPTPTRAGRAPTAACCCGTSPGSRPPPVSASATSTSP